MGTEYYTSPIEFLITTLSGMYIMAIMLRFLLQAVRADFYNPLSQFLVKITNPALLPLRRFIPGVAGLDMSAVALMFIIQMVTFAVVLGLRGSGLSLWIIFMASLIELIQLLINVYFFSILIQVILSWVQPGQSSPVTLLLWQLTEPVMRPARKMLPPMSGMDLSPMIVLLGLKIVEMLIIPPLRHLMM